MFDVNWRSCHLKHFKICISSNCTLRRSTPIFPFVSFGFNFMRSTDVASPFYPLLLRTYLNWITGPIWSGLFHQVDLVLERSYFTNFYLWNVVVYHHLQYKIELFISLILPLFWFFKAFRSYVLLKFFLGSTKKWIVFSLFRTSLTERSSLRGFSVNAWLIFYSASFAST